MSVIKILDKTNYIEISKKLAYNIQDYDNLTAVKGRTLILVYSYRYTHRIQLEIAVVCNS